MLLPPIDSSHLCTRHTHSDWVTAPLAPVQPIAQALSAVSSSVSTASTRVNLTIEFNKPTLSHSYSQNEQRAQHKRMSTLPAGLVHHFSALDLGLKDGQPVTSWPNAAPNGARIGSLEDLQGVVLEMVMRV